MERSGKRPSRDAEHAREAILDAALKRFSACGYKGARIADVAKDAGYSEALVYFHFRTKAELFREVVSRIDGETRWFDDDATPEALVAHLRDGVLRYHLDARWRALEHVWAEALGGERDLLELMRPQLRHAVGALEALLGRFDPVGHPERRKLVLLLLAVSYGSRVLRRYDPDAVTPEEAADLLGFTAEAVLRALRGDGAVGTEPTGG
jgi:AcrR family transcriptional regulator